MKKFIDIAYTSKEIAKYYKPRYYKDKEGIRLITRDKYVYLLHLKHVKKTYKEYITRQQDGTYIIITGIK
jgi:hypothetical protein